MQMHMCYKDESGTPEQGGTSHFVLLGLVLPAEMWKPRDREVRACCKPFNLEDCEIHTAWMARRYPEQDKIPAFSSMSRDDRRKSVEQARQKRLISLTAAGKLDQLKNERKTYRKSEPYIHLTHSERMDLLRKLADTIGGWQEARLFAEAVDKKHYFTQGVATPMMELAFTEVVQRFEYFLKRRGNFLNEPLPG
jgi:hypothetical protein